MRDYLVNKEAWHESWLRGYASLSRKYLEKEFGEGTSRSLVLRLLADDRFNNEEAFYEVKGELMMPRGGGILCARMASYAIAKDLIVSPGKVVGNDLSEFPPETFFLQALLDACYPYKADGSGFKAHAELMIGYDDPDDLSSEMGERAAMVAAFYGYGFILMQGLRGMIDPLANVEQITESCCESYLCAMERP